MLTQLLLLLLLLVLSGFFSSAETALFSISRTRARHLAKSGRRSHLLIMRLKEDPHRLLTTILIGNNVVNVGASAMATALAIEAFPGYAIGLATGVMTLLILVFGEVIPKSLATRHNVAIASFAILPIFWLSMLMWPVIVFLNFIPRLSGKAENQPTVTEEELMTFVEVGEEEGHIREEERELISNIFEFDDTAASEIMTPRGDMFVVDANRELDLQAIIESGFTRIPVIDSDIDHVIGILNIKDLFRHHVTTGGSVVVRDIMSDPYFVPENMKLNMLLQEFRERKQHIAIVVDEYGGVSGLITMEDALEELVGDITDETDKEEPHIVAVKPGIWMVLGKADIEEVNDAIPLEIPDTRDYDTFTGYILHLIGRMPEIKETLVIGDYEVTVEEMEGTRINKYTVRHKPQAPLNAEKPAIETTS
ncbi:MAG TPA: HlyC/CorC family transporter [Desulfobacteraceae bacterium]|nr:HlyC/CorC family transporter [Deltaproteobacteria bacterium]RLB92446.1 MAG: HlyC/CorC family transporter [Deltaproteobacteria bacterium]HDI61293.1 HlyC/CorC family transporter [Desulfobacteraceae bacterium]